MGVVLLLLLAGVVRLGAADSRGYLGAAACAVCHRQEAAHQGHTPMGRAAIPAIQSEAWKTHPKLTTRLGDYSYQVSPQRGQVVYSVSGPGGKLDIPLQWALGLGNAGQTFVFQRNGAWYESRVSYFRAIDGLDRTIGAPPDSPTSLEEAAGRKMGDVEAAQCFGCHTTDAVQGVHLDTSHMVLGIQCEACHGPGARHVASIHDGKPAPGSIVNPAHMSTEEISDFCGNCHRTWATVMTQGFKGINTIRFQPYRLVNSKCYDAADPRISCIACHNPHEDLQTDVAAYDPKCLACHRASAGTKARTCKVARDKCVTCHMPKYDLPGGHHQFTDHTIRIVKPGAPFAG